jgi:HEAT repeat protein
MSRASAARHDSRERLAARTRRARCFGALFSRGLAALFSTALAILLAAPHAPARTTFDFPPLPPQSELTPLQREIEAQKARLSSADVEERRDALMRLGALKRPESSRAAVAALADAAPVVRATAAHAVLSLGPDEAAALVLPLLQDRDEFVRREAAYALGETRSRAATNALVAALESDKKPSVRGAAAVALGEIGDASAVPALASALSSRPAATGERKRDRRLKSETDEFVRRAAAVSLGQIGSRDAVPALVEALSDERAPADVRRESARALGLIGDSRAVSALRAALTAQDPYLSSIAFEALKKIDPQSAKRPV